MCYHKKVIQVVEYEDLSGRSPYKDWFDGLNAPAAAKVASAIIKISLGNLAKSKSVGEGVSEFKIDFGPGYRIYFGRDGNTLVILLGGGTKQHQSRDIREAHQRWREYKQRKRMGEK